eukprot:CAMPEP_0167821324 /NCGR_PEP_ID=MMETSP0112_2-20121227/6717_1 /TAXON_ID=91324 /ORGANISM="Lotharella globosa, Strain CCCM811" /LENGTH=98 /DNA_ID=CAMNT_0007722247 /DNA_START=300 /DNA_END=596 /DNA_ORIENTATION=+
MDVRQNTASSNGDVSEEFVQLLIVADSQLNVTGNNARTLVVPGSVSGELENFSGEVFQNSSEIDWSSSSYACSVSAFPEETRNTTNRELESSASRPSG